VISPEPTEIHTARPAPEFVVTARKEESPNAVIDQESIRAALDDQGFAIVPNVQSSESVEATILEIESLISNNLDDQSRHALRHLVRSVPAVNALVESAMVRALIDPVLGPKAFVARSLLFDKTPEANWKVAWHQDLTIAVREKIETTGYAAWSVKEGIVHVQPPVSVLEKMLTIRLHLDDCALENGPLQIIPGSHRAGRMNDQRISEWRMRVRPVACVVPRGGALLMRPLLLHASSAAVVPKHRRVVHLEFAAAPLPGGLEWEAVG
jgi:ectoine hydroxylase-related dioxygenase (phytanoyl-CoA dioxygenase family)